MDRLWLKGYSNKGKKALAESAEKVDSARAFFLDLNTEMIASGYATFFAKEAGVKPLWIRLPPFPLIFIWM